LRIKYLLADKHHVKLEGALTWAFEFEDQPYFAGQRALATNGIDLPVLNVFRMLSRMSGRRVTTTSSQEVPLEVIEHQGVRGAADVAAMASWDGKKLAVLIWHYHDDDLPGADAAVHLSIEQLPHGRRDFSLTHYRIDGTHSNAYALWKTLGSPPAVNESEYAQLVQAGHLAELSEGPMRLHAARGSTALTFLLPRQAVSLLVLE
jgi:xylan 1,4-beta-xylosidase